MSRPLRQVEEVRALRLSSAERVPMVGFPQTQDDDPDRGGRMAVKKRWYQDPKIAVPVFLALIGLAGMLPPDPPEPASQSRKGCLSRHPSWRPGRGARCLDEPTSRRSGWHLSQPGCIGREAPLCRILHTYTAHTSRSTISQIISQPLRRFVCYTIPAQTWRSLRLSPLREDCMGFEI